MGTVGRNINAKKYGAGPQITCTRTGEVRLKPWGIVVRARGPELDTSRFKPYPFLDV